MLSSLLTSTNARLSVVLQRSCGGLVLVMALLLASCAQPESILKGTRIGVLPEVTVETADPAALAKGQGSPKS